VEDFEIGWYCAAMCLEEEEYEVAEEEYEAAEEEYDASE